VAWLGQVPAHWEVKKIKSLTKFSSGEHQAEMSHHFGMEIFLGFLQRDMKSKFIGSSEEYITQEGLQNTSGSIIAEGAVLMVVRSGILEHTIPVAINTVPVTINQDLKCIVLTTNVPTYSLLLDYWNIIVLLHLWSKQGATVEVLNTNTW
jgi:type I restriction enzyme S subunit